VAVKGGFGALMTRVLSSAMIVSGAGLMVPEAVWQASV
jgi:hypothetical protein